MHCNVTAAEYYQKSGAKPAVLHINKIVDGYRTLLAGFNVSGKAEARRLAKRYGAIPWNF